MSKKIIDNKTIWLLFGLCWFVYFISYVGRMNYSAAMPEMIEFSRLTMQQAGSLSTAFFVCYALGQFINGMLADKNKPENMIFTGLGLSAIVNLCLPIAHNYILTLILWAINGYALSMLWPSIIRIIADMFEARTMIKCGVHIASSIAAGSLAAYLLASLLIRFFGWQSVFFMAFGLLLITSGLWKILFSYVKKRRSKYGVRQLVEESDPSPSSEIKSGQKGKFAWYLFFILLIPIAVQGAIKDGVTAWIPTMLTQTFAAPAYTAVLTTSMLPIINLSGAYMANSLFKRCIKNEILCSAVFFSMALAGIVGIIFIGSVNILLTTLLFSVVTSSVLAINVLLINLLPLRFHQVGRTATLSGLFNAAAYVGSSATAVSIGWLAGGFGWSVVMLCFAVLVIGAGGVCLFGGRIRLPEWSLTYNKL